VFGVDRFQHLLHAGYQGQLSLIHLVVGHLRVVRDHAEDLAFHSRHSLSPSLVVCPAATGHSPCVGRFALYMIIVAKKTARTRLP